MATIQEKLAHSSVWQLAKEHYEDFYAGRVAIPCDDDCEDDCDGKHGNYELLELTSIF